MQNFEENTLLEFGRKQNEISVETGKLISEMGPWTPVSIVVTRGPISHRLSELVI